MKSVCLVCNHPLEHHQKITAETVAASQGATFQKPVNGFKAPLSPATIGQYLGHDPLMSNKPITWETPFGTTPLDAPAGIAANAVPMFHALRRIQIESSPDAEATAGDLRRALLQINRLATEALR